MSLEDDVPVDATEEVAAPAPDAPPTSYEQEQADALDSAELTDFEREVVAGFEARQPGEEERAGSDSPPPHIEDAGEVDVAPVASPAAPGAAPSEEFVDFMGRQLTTEQAEQLNGLYDWAQSLTPEQ